MVSFRVKELQGPLFGLADDESALRRAFSTAGATVEMKIEDADLAQVSEYVGLDAEDGVRMLARFVGGGWRAEADPPGPTALGEFGEVLTFLQLLRSGKQPIRVVSYKHGTTPASAGDFPMPDYLLQNGNQTGCVEAKCSCPLDYFSFQEVVEGDNKHRWRQLAPCTVVPARWKDALRQLGHTETGPSLPLHDLVLKDKRVLKFPVDFGLAHIHLVHDARVNALRPHASASRMKTPKSCVELRRDCWNCMASSSKSGNQNSSADIISMHLHNEPGRLRLIGSGDNGGGQWRAAYQAWSVALWTRDPVLLGVADEQLVAATEQWLSLRPFGSPEALKIVRAGSNGYLRRATGSRGMRHLGARDRFPDAGPSDEADAIGRTEPEVELIDTIAANHFADGTPRRVRMAGGTRGITIYADRESIELRTSDRSQMSEALARSLCAKLVEVALTIFQGAEGHEVVLEALRPVSVTIGNEPHELGWRFFGSSNPFACFVLRTLDGRIRRSGTYWTMALSLGDPRTSMGAHADGRAFLRFPRSLSSEHTTVWFST